MHFNPSQVLFTIYTPVFLRQFKLRCHKSLTARLTHNLCYCALSPLTNINGAFWSVSCIVCQINQFISLSLWCHFVSVPIWLFVFFFYLKIGIALYLDQVWLRDRSFYIRWGGGGGASGIWRASPAENDDLHQNIFWVAPPCIPKQQYKNKKTEQERKVEEKIK